MHMVGVMRRALAAGAGVAARAVPPSTAPPVQTPFMQPAPFAHTLPHAPQLRGSFATIVQNCFWPDGSRHAVMPVWQLMAATSVHRPFWQN